jgi:hypothetical protein
MPLVLMVISVLTGCVYWYFWIRGPIQAADDIVDAAGRLRGAHRRRLFRATAEKSPISAVEDPVAAATAVLIGLAVRSGRLSERAETAIKAEMRTVMGVAEVEEPFTFAFWLAEQVNDVDDLTLKFKTLWLRKLGADERADLHAMASRVAAVDGPPSDAQRASLLLLKDRLGLVGP